jgi:protein-S-isoprenylcysteine O-methyltransferase
MRLPSPGLLGLVYFVSELLLAITRRSRKGESSATDRNSLRFLWIAIIVGLGAGIAAAELWPGAALPHKHAFAAAGMSIFIAGLILRWYAIVKLGRFFTVNVAIAKDHQLIESGPYRFVRHPSYTGALLAFLGFGLSLGNWVAVIIIMAPIFLAFVYRMDVEERALICALGEQYQSYLARTKRLVPLIY